MLGENNILISKRSLIEGMARSGDKGLEEIPEKLRPC